MNYLISITLHSNKKIIVIMAMYFFGAEKNIITKINLIINRMTGMAQNCILFALHSNCIIGINYMVSVLFRIFGRKIIMSNVFFKNLF